MRWASSQVHGNRPRLFTLLVETTPSPPPLSLPLPLPAFRSFVLEKTHVFFSSLSLVCVNLFGMQRILHWLTSSFSRAPSISWRQMNPSLMSMWPKWSAMAPAGCIPRQASGTQRSLKLWFFKRWGGGRFFRAYFLFYYFVYQSAGSPGIRWQRQNGHVSRYSRSAKRKVDANRVDSDRLWVIRSVAHSVLDPE